MAVPCFLANNDFGTAPFSTDFYQCGTSIHRQGDKRWNTIDRIGFDQDTGLARKYLGHTNGLQQFVNGFIIRSEGFIAQGFRMFCIVALKRAGANPSQMINSRLVWKNKENS